MNDKLPSASRVLPSLNWQLAGAGRTAGALAYLDPATGRIHELMIARLVHVGHNFATVVFDNPAIPPSRILANPAQQGLHVGSKVLAQLRFMGPSEVSVQRWFQVGKAKPAPFIRPNPIQRTVARINGVIIKVDSGFRFGFAEGPDGSRYFVPARACKFPLRVNTLVNFTAVPSASGPLAEAVDVRLASAA